jgi:uncharacterized protein YaaR (DUF327 family)
MTTDTAQSEIQSFYEYLGRRIQNGGEDLSPEQCVREFRAYQQELKRFIRETQPAIEQSQRSESKPLDVEAVMHRVHKRLARESGTD